MYAVAEECGFDGRDWAPFGRNVYWGLALQAHRRTSLSSSDYFKVQDAVGKHGGVAVLLDRDEIAVATTKQQVIATVENT